MLTHVTRNEEQWEAFVLAHGGGFLQSWGWSEFQQALGRQVYRFRIDMPGESRGDTGHEDTIAQFTLIEHELPFGRRYAYVPRGPIVSFGRGEESARGYLETCIGAMRQRMRESGAIFARVEWPFRRDSGIVRRVDLERWGFRQVRSVQPADTVIVDLTKGEPELLAAMKQKTRYNIRVAERHGVTVREAKRDDAHYFRHEIDAFWRLLAETAERDKFHTHPRGYYETMLDVLSPKKRTDLRVRLVLADLGGETVAGGLFAEYGDTVTYLHGASSAAHRQAMAPYLLHWHVMVEAKRAGFGRYDLWGVAPNDSPEHPWAGITRFKTGFGGARVGYHGAWELPGNPFWYTLYRYAKRFRNV